MDDKNISVNETQSIGFFSKLQSNTITSNEPPKPTPITSNHPPKPTPITSNHPPQPTPITSNHPPQQPQPQVQVQVEQPQPQQQVQVEQPQVQVEQPQPQPQPQVQVEQPQVQVEQPQPQPQVQVEQSQVQVEQPQPQPQVQVEQRQVQVEQQLQVEEIQITHKDIALDFINKVNGVTKNLGHNKLQLQVDELEKQIEKFKSNEKEYEMKMNLFKKTISTLQGQLQERSAYITMMDKQHIDPQYEKQIEDLKQIINEKDILLSNKNEDITDVIRQVDILNMNLRNLTIEREELIRQTNDAKKHYGSLETHHQRQSNQLQVSEETINKLENKIILEENLKMNLQKELSDMKEELVKYRTDIKNMTIQKDYEIDSLKKQIETLNEHKPNDQSKTLDKKITINKIEGRPLPRKDPNNRSRLPTNGVSRKNIPI
jgi:ribosomal protein L29